MNREFRGKRQARRFQAYFGRAAPARAFRRLPFPRPLHRSSLRRRCIRDSSAPFRSPAAIAARRPRLKFSIDPTCSRSPKKFNDIRRRGSACAAAFGLRAGRSPLCQRRGAIRRGTPCCLARENAEKSLHSCGRGRSQIPLSTKDIDAEGLRSRRRRNPACGSASPIPPGTVRPGPRSTRTGCGFPSAKAVRIADSSAVIPV